MKKENVYVEVRTEKQAKKLKKVLEMFGENIFSNPNHCNDDHNGSDEYWRYGFSGGSWQAKNLNHYSLRDIEHTEVTIKQLRNILAIKHLKEGDVVVFDNGFGRWVVSLKSFDDNLNVLYHESASISDDYLYGYKSYESNIVEANFIRYATDEEKELLKPAELTADDYKDLTWYKSTETGYIFFLDKSKSENYGFYPEYIDRLEWFFNFRKNGFYKQGEWIEATYKEVTNLLEKECVRRYGDNWKEVKLVKHADGDRLGNINKGMFANNIVTDTVWNINGMVFYKGVWAEVVKKEQTVEEKVIEYAKSVDWDFIKVYKFIDCEDGVSGLSNNDYSLLEGDSVLGKTITFLGKHNKRKC